LANERIVRNVNHHISEEIVEIAVNSKSAIWLERLEGIRENRKHRVFDIP
jgi:IS605 OrfB family transposase